MQRKVKQMSKLNISTIVLYAGIVGGAITLGSSIKEFTYSKEVEDNGQTQQIVQINEKLSSLPTIQKSLDSIKESQKSIVNRVDVLHDNQVKFEDAFKKYLYLNETNSKKMFEIINSLPNTRNISAVYKTDTIQELKKKFYLTLYNQQ